MIDYNRLMAKRTSSRNWIQKANTKMVHKGTTGSFTTWCKKHDFKKVNPACITAAKKVGGKVAKKAVFAQNVRKV